MAKKCLVSYPVLSFISPVNFFQPDHPYFVVTFPVKVFHSTDHSFHIFIGFHLHQSAQNNVAINVRFIVTSSFWQQSKGTHLQEFQKGLHSDENVDYNRSPRSNNKVKYQSFWEQKSIKHLLSLTEIVLQMWKLPRDKVVNQALTLS